MIRVVSSARPPRTASSTILSAVGTNSLIKVSDAMFLINYHLYDHSMIQLWIQDKSVVHSVPKIPACHNFAHLEGLCMRAAVWGGCRPAARWSIRWPCVQSFGPMARTSPNQDRTVRDRSLVVRSWFSPVLPHKSWSGPWSLRIVQGPNRTGPRPR